MIYSSFTKVYVAMEADMMQSLLIDATWVYFIQTEDGKKSYHETHQPVQTNCRCSQKKKSKAPRVKS